ncbi:MAG: biopolymer transporter ExbD [Planctomycetota bacterium]
MDDPAEAITTEALAKGSDTMPDGFAPSFFPKYRPPERYPVPVGPLVDVIFLLLLFLLLTSPLVQATGFPVDLPRGKTARPVPGRTADIVIRADNAVEWNGQRLTRTELERRLKTAPPDHVRILGHRRAALETFVAVWDACQAAGVKRTTVAVVPEDGNNR